MLTGLNALRGILLALRARERERPRRSGSRSTCCRPCSSALANQAASTLATGVSAAAARERASEHRARTRSSRRADRELVIAVGNDRQFAALAATLGLPELAGDARFATNAAGSRTGS